MAVYDVTDYLDEHPGGDDVLLNAAGKDATEEFEDAGHSKSARLLMQDYCIGEIDPSPVIPELEIISKEQNMTLVKKLTDKKTLQYWVLPAAIVGISVAVVLLHDLWTPLAEELAEAVLGILLSFLLIF
ncbi:Cytochrome b5 isoform A [Asimina triloba]